MSNLLIKELELEAKTRRIKNYEGMSIDELLSILNVSEPIKENKPISDIRKENSNTDKIPQNTRKFFSLEKDKDIKDRALGDIRNLFRLEKKKDVHDELLGNIRTTFRLKKKTLKTLKAEY